MNMPYFQPGDPYPRKTPAELKAEEDALPVTRRIRGDVDQFISRRDVNVTLWVACVTVAIALLTWATRGC